MTLTTPPPARLAFRVGIVGHLPDRLPKTPQEIAGLRARIDEVLTLTKAAVVEFKARHPDGALYEEGAPPLMRAVSPLADGSDRIFAEAALDHGYALCCPMPFAQAEYEADFDDASRTVFRELLDRARTGPGLAKFELDATRSDKNKYGPAGRVVLNQSDILVVVWDGEGPNERGGTVDTLYEAIRFRVPVLWIDAHAPFDWTLVRQSAELDCLANQGRCTPGQVGSNRQGLKETIAGLVEAELALAKENDGENPAPRARADTYLKMNKPKLNMGLVWKPFRDLVGSGKFSLPVLRAPDFVEAIRIDWPIKADPRAANEPEPAEVTSWVNQALRPHFAWADKPADLCADAHRSAFVAVALLAAGAVLVALLPMALGSYAKPAAELGFAIGELVILATMLFLLGMGRRRRWHQRWMEYRVLAELIRQLRFMIPLGGGRPLPRTPTHLKVYGDPARSWMYWRVRAIAREVGIPEASATRVYIGECLAYLQSIVLDSRSGQKSFHAGTKARCEKIHHRLHSAAFGLFLGSIGVLALHLAILFVDPLEEFVKPWEPHLGGFLVLLSAFLPALGAALASINNQGEFARLAKRSHAMEDGFTGFEAKIAALQSRNQLGEAPPRMAEVTDLASRMAAMMVDEVIDWRVVVLDLPQVA